MSYFDPIELAGLDEIISDIEHSAENNADLVNRLEGFSIKIKGDISDILAENPHSIEYLQKIKIVHEEIIGRKHSSDLEGLPKLNLEYESNWPYPWGTQCADTVGRFLISYGYLIRSANLPKSAKILEVGCGMGSLTWNLARMGYRVDAIDPNDVQCASVRSFTSGFPVPPTVVASTLNEWLTARDRQEKYDAVIFFESFHHLMDHRECLRALLDDHLKDDGKIILAAEPIFADVSDILPYQWGPRLDGESLRAMRNWGWLELGFTEKYIGELFDELKIGYQWFRSAAAAPHSELVVASRVSLGAEYLDLVVDQYPAKFGEDIDLSKDGIPTFVKEITGLAKWESWGRWSDGDAVRIEFAEPLPKELSLSIVLADIFGPNLGKKIRVKIGTQEREVSLNDARTFSQHMFKFSAVEASTIEIVIPMPTRPCDLPELKNGDRRRLGIGIRALRVREDIPTQKKRGIFNRLFTTN